MKILRPRHFIVFAMVTLSGVALLHTSQNVQQAETRLHALEASVQREDEKLRLLKAEWESLNRPERLEALAKAYLSLIPPAPETLVQDASAVPEAPLPLMEEEGAGAPVTQAAAFGGEEKEAAAPVIQSTEEKPQTKPEKDFSDLLGEMNRSDIKGGAE